MPLENISVWTIPPDWSEDVTETLEWLTGVLASPIGAEQRFALRRTPRRSFEMTFKPNGPTRTLFDLFVQRSSGSSIYIPLWHDSNRLAVASSGSSLTLQSVAYTEFEDCPGVFIQGADPFDYEIAEFSSLASNMITVVDPLDGAWPVGTRVFPMIKGRIDAQPQAARKADRTYQVRVRFSSDMPSPTHSTTVLGNYRGRYALEREPNDVQDLTFEYQRLLAELDGQTGKRTRIDLNPWGSTIQQFTFFAKRRTDHNWLRALFYALQGRLNPIFVPTFFADIDAVEPLSTDTITVKRCGYTDYTGPFRGRRYVAVQLHNGVTHYRKIISSVLIGGGDTENIVLDEGFTPTVPLSAIKRISFMAICRLDQDSLEIVHHTDSHGLATCTANFRSIVQARNPVGGGATDDLETDESEPALTVYFEFRVDAADGQHNICIGIANESFILDNPARLNVNIAFPDTFGGAFIGMKGNTSSGGHAGWGYPNRMGSIDVSSLGQTIGVLVLLDLGLMYACNASVSPDVWKGTQVAPTTNPTTGEGGFDFTANITSGPIYILGGCGAGNAGATLPMGTLNADEPFVRSTPIPRNGVPWGATVFNEGDKDSHIVLTNGDFTVSATLITSGGSSNPYTNQPTAFVRSATSKVLP